MGSRFRCSGLRRALDLGAREKKNLRLLDVDNIRSINVETRILSHIAQNGQQMLLVRSQSAFASSKCCICRQHDSQSRTELRPNTTNESRACRIIKGSKATSINLGDLETREVGSKGHR